jgi:hypothetical protein
VVKDSSLDKAIIEALAAGVKEYKKSSSARANLITTFQQIKSKFDRAKFVHRICEELTITTSCFYDWVKKYNKKGADGLKHKVRSDKGTMRKKLNKITQKLVQYTLLDSAEWNISSAIRIIQRQIDEGIHDDILGIKQPDERPKIQEYGVRRWIDTTKLKDQHARVWHAKSCRNLYQSVTHARGINPPCTIWQVDDHDQDLLVWIKDKHGDIKQGRPKAIRVIDPETNMLMGWCLTDRAYGSLEIKKAILHAITRTGVLPEQIFLEGDRRMQEKGILDGLTNFLRISIYSTKYNPTAKANVEKSFHADRLEFDSQYDSYISNNPQNRPDDADKRVYVDFSEYEKDYNEFCEHWNTMRKSKFNDKVYKTPVEMWNDWVNRGWAPNRITEDMLPHLPYWLGKAEIRTISASMVQFSINGEKFKYLDDLDAPCLLSLRDGFKVTIRRHFETLRTGYVYVGEYPNDLMVGKIKIQEKIGYGYGEFADIEAIEYVKALRKLTSSVKVDRIEHQMFSAYLKEAKAIIKDKDRESACKVSMLIPNRIIKLLRHAVGEACEIRAKQDEQQLQEVMNSIDTSYIPKKGYSKEEIDNLLKEIHNG